MAELSKEIYFETYLERGYTLGKIRTNTICYDYHDDMPFRIHYLMNGDISLMRRWRRLDHGKKGKRKKVYSAKYINNLLARIVDTPITGTTFDWSCQKKKGQILMPVPFAIDRRGVHYPAGGMGRITAAYYLGHRYIPAFVISTKVSHVWKKNFGVGSKHFDGMPEDIIKMLLFRREISNAFAVGVCTHKTDRPDFLYQIPDLAFRGKYDAEVVVNDKEFISLIKNKNILNITLDNGWFDVLCSRFAKSIVGYGLPLFKEIASKVYNYFGAENGVFVSDKKEVGNDIDIVITNKSIDIPDDCLHFLESRKIIYDKDGCKAYG